jgi:hypothetical protein
MATGELVPYEGGVLSPLPGLLNTVEGWRAVERWYLRQIDEEWERAEDEYLGR